MATGALDANGIWRYGEDDPVASPTWSAYLDKIGASVSAKLTALALESAWTAYAPTFTGFTLGNGTVTARTKRIGKTTFVSGLVTLGSTSSMTGSLSISLPVNVTGAYNSTWATLGTGMAKGVPMTAAVAGAGAIFLRNSAGSAVGVGTPGAWASGDAFTWSLMYEGI